MRKLRGYKPTKFKAKDSKYSKEHADFAVNFIQCLKHTKGTWAGKPFELIDWQERIIRDLFGILKPNGYRQFTTAYVEIPKKQGKSELAAAVALLLCCGDGEERAEVYGCAADRQQASIVFEVAADMVRMCPSLNKRVKILASQKRLIYLPTNSFYQVLSADAYSKHGFNVSGVIFDELHTQPNRKLFDVMTKGSGDARMQPLYFLITTAGTDTHSICYETHQKAKDILEGRKIDSTFYPVIYGADESEDWSDPKVWKKANPSLGITVPIEKVRDAFNSARQNPGEENAFRQLRLNQWVKQSIRWMPMEKWDACAFPVSADDLEGRICYGGLDLSSTTDITAFVLVFPPLDEEDKYQILAFFWIPEENLELRVRRDHVPYDVWERQGFLQTTEGNVVHYGYIEKFIEKLGERYHIREIAFDRWGAVQMVQNLEGMGFTVVPFGQGFKDMYACITDTVVNYRQFGAKLDGETDDGTALANAHLYQRSVYTIEPESERKRYTVKVANHDGIIRKDNNEPIVCCGDIDLSGSRLLVRDCNATWFGFYLWGDNEIDYMTYEPVASALQTYKKDNFIIGTMGNEGDVKQNALIFLKEDPYAVRDDGGYLYSEPRYELLLHTTDGLLAQPFTEDWDRAGGEEISAPFSDYNTHQVTTDTLISHFTINYTRLPSTHYHFTGCEVKLNTSANKYCSVLWCKCHNAHISGFTFYPDSAQMHNTQFKNTMIYADHKIYKVLNSGRLRERPPIDTAWRGAFTEGTARLSFMGKDWAPVTWWARDCYCVSMVNGVRTVYKLVNQDGTTSGQIPVSGNAMSVDGDMIWEYTTDTATKQWAAQTQFFEGDVVSANGNNYRCVFDGRLELPHQITLENISTNMDTGGDVFAFWEAGTDVPTKVGPKGKWTIRIDNVEFYRFRNFSSYFCHAGNPAPEILIGGSGSGGSSGGSSGTDANAIHDGDSVVIDAGEV